MTPQERNELDLVENVFRILGMKWKPAILYCLFFQGKQRFTDLRKAMPDITQKMLTQRLRELERDGLLTRTFYEQIPPRVEYEITELGRTDAPILDSICKWGIVHEEEVVQANMKYDKTH